MNIREALIHQSPSLALQRAAADEIARLDTILRQRDAIIVQADNQLSWIQKYYPDIYTQSRFWDQS